VNTYAGSPSRNNSKFSARLLTILSNQCSWDMPIIAPTLLFRTLKPGFVNLKRGLRLGCLTVIFLMLLFPHAFLKVPSTLRSLLLQHRAGGEHPADVPLEQDPLGGGGFQLVAEGHAEAPAHQLCASARLRGEECPPWPPGRWFHRLSCR